MADLKAKLELPGNDSIELPVKQGSAGFDVIDISKLGSKGYFTFDPGFLATASCESAITYIDGDQGILLHRGYPIEQLAVDSDYLDLCYLLLYGELPTAHPMAMLCGVTGALSAFYQDSLDVNDPRHREIAAYRLVSKMPTIAAMCYKYSSGQPFVYPRNDLSYAGNFLSMMFAVPCEEYKVNPIVERAMDRIFILHADHEQNASTSTVRLAGSSGANPFACIAAGIASLWGPAHGGANEACLQMLEEIGSVDRIPEFIARAKDKNDPFRLMGFGHRVYKNFDPRAKVMRETCHEVLKELKVQDPLLDVAMELERIALEDEYFISKKLYPNVDFYSGIIMKAIGIPTSMFTVLFALARTVGWIAHWKEMLDQPGHKISRPRQLYTGETARDFVDLDKR